MPRFESELLPKYYRHHNYESFQRQLNMYGFKRLKGKRDGGAYFHPMLRRNRKDLVPYIGYDGSLTAL